MTSASTCRRAKIPIQSDAAVRWATKTATVCLIRRIYARRKPREKFPIRSALGCPAGDADSDGVLDPEDLCPSEPVGKVPDPNRKGCPDKDSDGDGVFDSQDQCKDVHAGLMPDDESGLPVAGSRWRLDRRSC